MEKENKLVIITCGVFCLLILSSLALLNHAHFTSTLVEEPSDVVSVIDGDTFVLESGQYVRLIGVNAPEKGEPYYEESTRYLSSLLINHTIVLERDTDNRDSYGRLLRYVYVGEVFVNAALVEEGYAVPLTIEPNSLYAALLQAAYTECKEQRQRLCA